MAYAVSLTARAERDLDEIYEHLRAAESAAARRWFEALKQTIFTLQEHPNRCAVTPESKGSDIYSTGTNRASIASSISWLKMIGASMSSTSATARGEGSG